MGLHPESSTPEKLDGDQENNPKPSSATTPIALVAHASHLSDGKYVMLSTVAVYIYNDAGARKLCRVLLDCGSQANFVSKSFVSALGLKPRSLNVSISGINGASTKSTQIVCLKMSSRINSYSFDVECIVTDQVTDKLPSFTLNRGEFNLPRNLPLADPRFHESSEIDALIGAELFWDLLCVGQIKSSQAHPTLQKTRLGWILAGGLDNPSKQDLKIQACHAAVTNLQLHEELTRFWQREDISNNTANYTVEEAICKKHFADNTLQNQSGRYVVKLPVKEHVMAKIGQSRDIAMKQLLAMERRFKRDPNLQEHYVRFMQEYVALGHMKLVDEQPDDDPPAVYLPHHSVVKMAGQSLKIRVVFDASCKTTTGVSLNDALRTHLQRILWRSKPNHDIKAYESLVVTYGTAAAAYLATECLNNLAEKNASRFPVGSIHLKEGCYVDDVATGADTKKDLEIVRHQVVEILRLGAFKLSKWASNCPELLKDVQDQNHEPESHSTVSKRTILSGVARLFDPLGLLGPVIVVAKLILQDLWKSGNHWDESVPQDIHARWSRLKEQLSVLKQVRVPRCVKLATDPQLIQIHRFCDASQKAYGAVIYLRTKLGTSYRTELLCSKSRVTPLKAISLARLELQAALLLAELMDKTIPPTYYHVDYIRTNSWKQVMVAWTYLSAIRRRPLAKINKAHRPTPATESVSHNEMSHALGVVCKAVERSSFPDEYRALTKGDSVSASSKILSLSPFIDETGLIRVGGRLKNSELKFDACYPILLPRDHELTKRTIRQEHVRNMHAGTQATMAAVKQRFWPLSLRSTARKIIRNCVTCFRAKPSQSEALMGSLPSTRVTVSRPFSHCNVDYAGPVMVKEGKRRAHKQIKEFYDLINDSQVRDDINQFVREQETSSSFIPPNAPHFGGLWEAAVKSAKYHMARIIGQAHLTFVEMQTVLCEVEAILNSRPLTQLSADPNDLAYLSPGHFLVERTKWKANKGVQLKPEQLVLIKQQGLAPLQWLLGRVQNVHTGADGVTRVATVRTTKGKRRRRRQHKRAKVQHSSIRKRIGESKSSCGKISNQSVQNQLDNQHQKMGQHQQLYHSLHLLKQHLEGVMPANFQVTSKVFTTKVEARVKLTRCDYGGLSVKC
ncbi:uncharacterized protein [Temnothorax longispinosus]|uniref:uncharacterized protein n=1 Tax=Temnothorax longispinosus TaxID=300112 RepID=UPI003A9941DA